MRWKLKPTSILLLALGMMISYYLWMEYRGLSYEDEVAGAIGDAQLDQQARPLVQQSAVGPAPQPRPILDNTGGARILRNYCNVYNLSVANHNEEFRCILMKTNPPAPVCIYPVEQDKFISHDLEDTGLWESHVLDDFMDVLGRDASLGVLDIGANVGVYTMIAAKMGHSVVAVEPYTSSVQRIHRAVKLAQLENEVVLLQNAVADVRTGASLLENIDNKGDVKIILGDIGCNGGCPQRVQTILLDDLLQVITFSRAVIKIDCQGYEHRAFQHARELLQTIAVPYIYMEWMTMREHYASATNNVDVDMIDKMVNMLLKMKYRPYALDAHGAHALDIHDWHHWPTDIVWRHLPNDQEYAQLLRNHFMNWP